jgi:alkanesulfonate monooxygenase SsuD/methylene tetrahydromethanopterin reductase-like flavin-dependent oxidoreductase (luciferase family)
MRCSIWVPGAYASEGLEEGWPAPGSSWEPARGSESIGRAFELFDIAANGGFDMLSVAEHHYGHNSLVPSPIVMAAALSQKYPDVKIGILGPVLPLSNPVRVAEEIAMVDVLSGGRTVVGFFRGIASEQVVYGNNPAVTADMFREAFALVLHAWAEPETFGWEGRNYRFRLISVFPRPLQQPHPPIVASAATPEAAQWTGAQGHMLGIFAAALSPERASSVVDAFRAAREQAGTPASDEDVVYRARVYVAATDAEAEQDVVEHGIGDMRRTMAPAARRALAGEKVTGALFAASSHGPPVHGGGGGLSTRPDFVGSPETVARQISQSMETIGWGFLDGLFTFPGLPHEKSRRSLELFAGEVLPALR